MDARILRDEADKARAEAESLKLLAEHKADKAEGLEGFGSPEKADLERREMKNLQDSAEEYEKKAAALEAMLVTAHKRVEQLNAEEERIRSEYESKLKAIESERNQLLGK